MAESVDRQFKRWKSGLKDRASGQALSADEVNAGLSIAVQAMKRGREPFAIEILNELLALAPESETGWQLLGYAHRAEQDTGPAMEAFERALALKPDDITNQLNAAHTAMERGLPMLQIIRRARELHPDNLVAVRTEAAALANDGDVAGAERLLDKTLEQHPDWLEGHQTVTALRWTNGQAEGFTRSYEQACKAQPNNLELRVAWFRAVAQARHWESALAIVNEGEQLFGTVTPLAVAKLFIAEETRNRTAAEQLFKITAGVNDTARDLAFIRHCLRWGQPERAVAMALKLAGTTSASVAWPYLSIVWRLLGNNRAQWLDGAPPFIRVVDLELSSSQIEELATLLRQIHATRVPFMEHAVRQGTQTERHLLLRADPILEVVRARVIAQVQDYARWLPKQQVSDHPLLFAPRVGRVRFSASWSVRLGPGGHLLPHTHPAGWVSSTLYVSLPTLEEAGPNPASFLQFGAPPPDLGLTLPPYGSFDPKVGQLILYPSTMWHHVAPIGAGERLSMSFDAQAPRP